MNNVNKQNILPRKVKISETLEFLGKAGAGLTYLRGRRRTGKSFILKQIQKDHMKHCFYFSGSKDEDHALCLKRFIQNWEDFSKEQQLSSIKDNLINWNVVFKTILSFAVQKKTWLFFDEIQWIAKINSGFLGALKEIWSDLEQKTNIKIILCGSSKKFFLDSSGGEEKILRGLKTRADILVGPFTPYEIKKNYAHKWSDAEIAFLYMITGGVPYYINQINFDQSLLKAINTAFFTNEGIFLNEPEEILNLEFNRKGLPTVFKIFSTIGPTGRYMEDIVKLSRLPASTVSEAIEKLVQYELIKEEVNFDERIKLKRKKMKLFINDFFLQFYFSLMHKKKNLISKNQNLNIFKDLCESTNSDLIQIKNFSGVMFENFLNSILTHAPLGHPIYKELNITDYDFRIIQLGPYDLVLKISSEKTLKLIECKFTGNQTQLVAGLEQLIMAPTRFKEFVIEKYLFTNLKATASTVTKAKNAAIKIVSLSTAFAKWES